MPNSTVQWVQIAVVAAVGLRWAAQAWLNALNRRNVEANRAAVPEAFRDSVDATTYAKSVDYTLAKSRFGQWEEAWETLVLLALLFCGILPWSFNWFESQVGSGTWARALWLFAVGVGMSIPSIPFEWWSQFRLEERFGFNTTTLGTWLLDRIKGLGLGALIGLPLIALILRLFQWTGDGWWFWSWAVMMAFQLLMMVLAPKLILPLFNKLTPLEAGALRERLLKLGERTGFSAKTILVMDGSKRSRHSNAFFTGFGRARKIVLFDTLIAQLTEAELEAVLAHEIGHYKRGHIPKMLVWAALSSLAGFAVIGWLAKQAWLVESFGFQLGNGIAPVLLLFALLSGAVTFWMSPLMNFWSRRHEYEADAYARDIIGAPTPLIGALRKLTEKNLSNLTPHPAYSAFYYSHPTLLEREQAISA